MALSHVELYEALKATVGEEAARLMANVIPPAENLTTKQDLADSTAKLGSAIADVRLQVSTIETKIEASSKETMRWMLGFFIPVWAGTWATVIAVLLKH